jgi:uncharacterized repeat protein (TIGR01451 family)
MIAAPLSLCRRWVCRCAARHAGAGAVSGALATCVVAALVSISPVSEAQLVDWSADRTLRLEPALERVVESKEADGSPRYELARRAVAASGEQFVLTLRFTNSTGATVDGVRITTAIPAGLRYVAGSATVPGGLVLFSADGGHTFGTEQELAAKATPDGYTHVRWVLLSPLEAGATGFVRLFALSR